MPKSTQSTDDWCFEAACAAIGSPSEAFWFRSRRAEHAERLTARIKLAAKLLGQAIGLGHSLALLPCHVALPPSDNPTGNKLREATGQHR